MSGRANDHWNLWGQPASPEVADAVARLQMLAVEATARQLGELARMRAAGMGWVRRLEDVLDGRIDPDVHPAFVKSRGFVPDLVKVARAVRQIMVLEHELAGLRPARRRSPEDAEPAGSSGSRRSTGSRLRLLKLPLPDKLDDYYDYRPVGEAVGWIRGTLGIEPPADDPFRGPELCTTEPEPEPPVERDVPEPDAPEADAATEAPSAMERRVPGRAYDLDYRDLTGEDLRVAPVPAGATARGPP